MFSADNDSDRQQLRGIRAWLNRNPVVVVVGCVACMALLMTVFQSQRQAGPRHATHEWYYDTDTRQLVAEPRGLIPPLREHGRELWLARVFTCAGCDEGFIAYFEKFTPEAKLRLEELKARGSLRPLSEEEEAEQYDLDQAGRLYSLDGQSWLPMDMDSEYDLQVMAEARCSSELKRCWPTADDVVDGPAARGHRP